MGHTSHFIGEGETKTTPWQVAGPPTSATPELVPQESLCCHLALRPEPSFA